MRTCACSTAGSCVRGACSASVSMMVRMLRIGTRSASRPCSTRTTTPSGSDLRHQVLDQPRRGLGQAIEQLLHLLVAEQFVRVRLDDVAQVRGDDGAGIDHGVAERLRLLALRRARSRSPPCRRPDRASRCPAGLPNTRPGIDRQLAIGIDDAIADRHARQADAIGVRRQLEVVADVHRLHQEAQLLRELAAHAADARQQFAALALVDQRHQAEADFQADQVDRLHVVPGQLARARCSRRRVRGGAAAAAGRGAARVASTARRRRRSRPANSRKARFGMPGIRPMTPSSAAGDRQAARLAEQLRCAARRPGPGRATCA